ncbi:hypothetical protein B566_EDAN016478 [Ephemera danica]|nr:hypothetical protein B566_EDAN016478 [Ephemera danica]
MRPPKKDGSPTTVFFHVTVMGLDSIDENSMTYAADIFFAQTWKDHRLRLPENMTSEYRFVFLALMEYCLVNIVLGDSDGPPKPNAEPPKPDKVFDLAAKENARLLTGQPPQPPRVPQAQRNRIYAINIDRFSRIGFPLLFAVLNATYWILFAEFL